MESLRAEPIAFAHRGARAHAPENTLEAFTLALKLGATGLESDVWLTADGAAVLDHDGVARIGRRRKAMSEVTRADVAHLPTLADLYDTCGTDYELSLDLKDGAAVGAVIATAREAGGDAEGRLWLCHPEWETVASWRQLTADAKLVDSTRLRKIKEGPERRAARLAEAGVDCINMHHTDWTGGLTTLFHRFDRHCFSWDVQHERVLLEQLRIGVDGVYSDHVDRMMDAIGHHRR